MNEIWIFRTGSLGDALVTLPAIHRIRALHPDARLVLVTNRPEGEIVSAWSILQHADMLDDAIFYSPGCLTSSLRLLLRMRRARPERLYYLAPMRYSRWQIRRDRFFFGMLGGTRNLKGLDWKGVRQPYDPSVTAPKEANRLLEIVDPGSGSDTTPAGGFLRVPDSSWVEAAVLLREAGWKDGQPLLAMVAGSKMEAKRWPSERYEELGRDLLQKYPDLFIVLLGSAGESVLSGRIASRLGPRSANLAGKTSLIQSAAILRRSVLYLGNDTGTMHLAAVVGTPCVALFSARDQAGKWEPFGDKNVVLRADVPCAGCMLMTCVERKMECLTRIGVGEARAAALPYLDAALSTIQPA